MPPGRHSSPDQLHFYKSVAAWFLPWVLIATVVGTAVWIAFEAVNGEGGSTPANAVETAAPEATEEPAATPAPATPEPRQSGRPSPEPSETPKPEEIPLITEGVTIQVLNATDSLEADDRMADRLSKLGYSVVAVESASSRYAATTVFWSADASREAAERLAQRFGWVAEAKPENLSDTVSLHVVVGADEV